MHILLSKQGNINNDYPSSCSTCNFEESFLITRRTATTQKSCCLRLQKTTWDTCRISPLRFYQHFTEEICTYEHSPQWIPFWNREPIHYLTAVYKKGSLFPYKHIASLPWDILFCKPFTDNLILVKSGIYVIYFTPPPPYYWGQWLTLGIEVPQIHIAQVSILIAQVWWMNISMLFVLCIDGHLQKTPLLFALLGCIDVWVVPGRSMGRHQE